MTDFDANDMRKYCIERIDGKSEADGGHALMLRARQKAIWETEQPAIGAVVDDPDWYSSHAMQSWAEICGQSNTITCAESMLLFGPLGPDYPQHLILFSFADSGGGPLYATSVPCRELAT